MKNIATTASTDTNGGKIIVTFIREIDTPSMLRKAWRATAARGRPMGVDGAAALP
jgi:hypothetical protein